MQAETKREPGANAPPQAMYKYLQDDIAQSQSKKVKCQRACKFCRKSHTTCDDTRPCQRCIKRDIAQLCLQDEADQLAQQAQQQAQAQQAGSSNGARSTVPSKRRQSAEHASDRRPSVPGPMFDGAGQSNGAGQPMKQTPSPTNMPPGSGTMNPVPLPNMMQSPTDTFRAQPMSGFDAEMTSPLAQTGSLPWYSGTGFGQMDGKVDMQGGFQQQQQQSQPQPQPPQPQASGSNAPEGFSWSALVEGMLDPMANPSPSATPDFSWLHAHSATPNGRSTLSISSGPGPGPPSTGSGVAESPGNRPQGSVASLSPQDAGIEGPIVPYNYTFGYSRLKTYAGQLGDNMKNRIQRATDRFKGTLHACLSQYTDDQIVSSEIQFLAFVKQWQQFADTLPVASCLFRRTTEVHAANSRLMYLIGMETSQLRSGKSGLYNILDPTSFLEYWENYAGQVLHHMADRSQFDIVLPIAFAKSPGEKSHLMSASIMFDSIGLPLVVTAVFTPLTPPMRRQDALGGGGGGHGGEPTIDVQMEMGEMGDMGDMG